MFLLSFFVCSIKSGENFTVDIFTYTILNEHEVQVIHFYSEHILNSITIPNYVNYHNVQYTVVSIYSKAFIKGYILFCSHLYFPSTLQKIEKGAISNFPSLSQIGYITNDGVLIEDELPPKITEINDKIFCNCERLQKIKINNTINKIGDYAFCNCSSLESFEVTLKNCSIGIGSFANCRNLKSFDFSQICAIENFSFQSCFSIQKVDLSKTPIKKIGKEAFFNCGGITEVIFPNSINEIGERAFGLCTEITSLRFKTDNIKISDFAFSACFNLDDVIFSNAPYYIGERAFYNCFQLKYFHSKNSSSVLQSTYIGKEAFYMCEQLTDFDFDKMPIYYIGDDAFFLCPLKSEIVFLLENSLNEFTISHHAFVSDVIETIDFGSPKTFDDANSFSFTLFYDSFSDCQSIKCVMVSKNFYHEVASSFDKKIVNGNKCPYYESKIVSIGIFVGVIILILVIAVAIVVCFIKYRSMNYSETSANVQPLLQSVQQNNDNNYIQTINVY